MTIDLQHICLTHGLTVSTAESCTGGNIAHEITKISGSSGYFQGSVVSYSNAIKEKVLGVSNLSLTQNGAVSEPVAMEMASGVRKQMQTDYSVSTTGIAGPTGAVENKPVGTVWIGVSSIKGTEAHRFQFKGDREKVIDQTTQKAIEILTQRISKEYL